MGKERVDAGGLLTCRVGRRRERGRAPDEVMQVTRARPRDGALRAPRLAPSRRLFEDCLRWRKAGEWPARWEEHGRRFLAETESPAARRSIDAVAKELMDGRRVAPACFCRDERRCHRRLVRRLVLDRVSRLVEGG